MEMMNIGSGLLRLLITSLFMVNLWENPEDQELKIVCIRK